MTDRVDVNDEKLRRKEYTKRIVAAVNYKGNDDFEDVPSILYEYQEENINFINRLKSDAKKDNRIIELQDKKLSEQEAEIERLQSMNQAKLDTIHDLIADIERLSQPREKHYEIRDCPFSPFDEYCTGNCVNCEDRLECADCSQILKSKAIEEFWTKVRAYAVVMGCFHIVEYGDNTLKEMVGEQND